MLLPDTGRAGRALNLLAAAERLGLDRREIQTIAGIEDTDLEDPDRRVATSRIARIWEEMASRCGDPDLGLRIGIEGDPKSGGVLGYAVLHSVDAGGALRRIARFSRIVSTVLDLDLAEGSRRWRLSSRRPPLRPTFRPPIDQIVASVVTILRRLTDRQIDPVEVHLPYPRPADPTLLRRVLRSELRFGAPRGALVYGAREMSTPVTTAEAQLARYLDRLAEQQLAALPADDTFSRRTSRLVWEHLSEGQPALAVVARELAVSPRTLQRRLREEGTSFGGLVDDVR